MRKTLTNFLFTGIILLTINSQALAQFEWSAVGEETILDTVFALAVFNDGSGEALFAGGAFGLKKWDGTQWSEVGPVFNEINSSGTVFALEVYDDGDGKALYVGGRFNRVDNIQANNIAKWDGTNWSALGTGIGGSVAVAAGRVFAIKGFNDGNGHGIYAGGSFENAGGTFVRSIAKWNGSLWSPLGNGVTDSFFLQTPGEVHALEVFDDGSGAALYVGGSFEFAWPTIDGGAFNTGTTDYNLAKWNGVGWIALGMPNSNLPGGPSRPAALALKEYQFGAGNTLYAGGFTGLFGSHSLGVLENNAWSPFASASGVVNSGVYSLAVYDDGSGEHLYVGGHFNYFSPWGGNTNNIIRWDGANWSPLLSSGIPGINGPVYTMAVFDDGSGERDALYVGGSFIRPTCGESQAINIACWSCARTSCSDPVALCQDVMANANEECLGHVSPEQVDAGSYDPDQNELTLTLDPAGPFSLGQTLTTLLVTNTNNSSAACSADITVVDSTPPTISCPTGVQTSTAANTCTAASVVLGNAEALDNCQGVQTSNNAPELFPLGATQVTWTAVDSSGNQSSCQQAVSVQDNTPPQITCPQDLSVSADSGSCGTAGLELGQPEASDNCGGLQISNNAPDIYPLGQTVITWTATDTAGNITTCQQNVEVVDDESPNITISTSTNMLWPPNHKLITVGLSAQISDNCNSTADANALTMVYSNEDDQESTGVGVHSPDAKDIAIGTLRLRSERKGNGNGRVYLIVTDIEDASGNARSAATTVVVPLNQSPAAKAHVQQMAAAALNIFETTGSPPPSYHVVGDGPIVGPMQ